MNNGQRLLAGDQGSEKARCRLSKVMGMVVGGGSGDDRIGGGRRRGWIGRIGGFGLGAEAGDGLPVVFARLKGEPLWQRHKEKTAESFGVRLVERAHLAKALA